MKVLCLHGLGCHSGYFQDMELPQGYQMLTYDLLGHGMNYNNEKINLKNMAYDQWMQLYERGNEKNVVLLGHSLGGLVAQEMYRMYPDGVKALILANTFSYCIPPFSAAIVAMREYNFNALTVDQYVEMTINNCLYDRLNNELREKAKKAFLIRKETYIDACISGAYADFYDLLPQINVPTLIISSTHDEVTKPYVHRDMHEKIRGSKLVTLERCGHLSNIEKPHEFNEAVRNFLNEQIT